MRELLRPFPLTVAFVILMILATPFLLPVRCAEVETTARWWIWDHTGSFPISARINPSPVDGWCPVEYLVWTEGSGYHNLNMNCECDYTFVNDDCVVLP